ncbi:MAG: hypothetical protein FJ399_21005, partial [Verrucomicrobia bacterium]|nr:hypothetical protein [Verrucomicrobiota bacterium]
DILALYLALKHGQRRLPALGHAVQGAKSRQLEESLDGFYAKSSPELGADSGLVFHVFQDRFHGWSSYDNNNWRDFFRYANGVSCLAPDKDLLSAFVGQPRNRCSYLTRTSDGDNVCSRHPKATRYIRGLGKPKLLAWRNPGPGGRYLTVDLDHPDVVESMRRFSRWIPIESLIVALYFGAAWHSRDAVSLQDFASDFHFAGVDVVEYLFACDGNTQEDRVQIAREIKRMYDDLVRPFEMIRSGDQVRLRISRSHVRDAAFRRAVAIAYDDACAVCGLQDVMGKARFVQACHIFPHHLEGADDIRNGIALCQNHHEAFDGGLFTLDEDYRLMWSPRFPVRSQIYHEGRIRLPDDRRRWPDQRHALAWHREHVFDQGGTAC